MELETFLEDQYSVCGFPKDCSSFDKETLAYYKQVKIEVQFVADFNLKEVLLRTFKEYVNRPQTLTLLIKIQKGFKIHHGVMPNLHSCFDGKYENHEGFFKSLKYGFADVPVSVVYRDLV
jgi:hypothetical protein